MAFKAYRKYQIASLLALGVLFYSSCAFAQDAQPSTVSDAAASQVSADTSASTQDTKKDPSLVTVDFKEADIHSVLRLLSLKSGVNIVAGKEVGGTVSIRLVNVQWEKALEIILKTYGMAYEREGNIIRVTTADNLKSGDLSTQIYFLNYAQASEVAGVVGDSLSERGKIKSDVRSNSLIITDMPTSLQKIEKVIAGLDQTTPQVLIETKVIELTLGSADKLGLKWNISVGLSGSSRPSSFPFESYEGPSRGIGRFLLENDNSGSAFAPLTSNDGADGARNQNFPLASAANFQLGTLDFSQYSTVLDMIATRSDARVLSEPHIVTLNNKEAKILIGEVLAIPQFERNGTTGKMEITGYEDRDVGIRLTVTPQININREIVVNVHPEITALLGYDDITADIKAPHFSSREAQTNVRVKDGQTIVIGGLIKEDHSKAKTEVPFLSSLPFVGNAFKHNNDTTTKTDLLFFMTVKIINDDNLPTGHPQKAL